MQPVTRLEYGPKSGATSITLFHSHSLRVSAKWLDINALCQSRLSAISSFIGHRVQLESVYYFSAYAHHLKDRDIVFRHKKFVKCLKDTGIQTELILQNRQPGSFKEV